MWKDFWEIAQSYLLKKFEKNLRIVKSLSPLAFLMIATNQKILNICHLPLQKMNIHRSPEAVDLSQRLKGLFIFQWPR